MKIGVVGASGYAGGELLRLLSHHEKFELAYISAGSNAGEQITSVHPHLLNFSGRKFETTGIGPINNCDLVFLALGFTGPEKNELLDQLEVTLDDKGNIIRDHEYSTASEGVFVCGDAGRGQSLIVWAIAEGRSAASAIDKYLTGNTQLPYPIEPTARPLMV